MFSESIEVYDTKVGTCSQLNDYMKLYEYQRSMSFIDLGPNHSYSIFLNFFSSITTWPIEFYVESSWDEGSFFKLFRSHNQDGHHAHTWWNPLKIFFSGTYKPMTLVYSITYYSSTTKCVQIMPQGWHWPILRQDQIWSRMLLYRKHLKLWIFRNYCSQWYKSW